MFYLAPSQSWQTSREILFLSLTFAGNNDDTKENEFTQLNFNEQLRIDRQADRQTNEKYRFFN